MTPYDYRMLSALIQLLPDDGRWTAEERDRWIAALVSVIDLMVDMEEAA